MLQFRPAIALLRRWPLLLLLAALPVAAANKTSPTKTTKADDGFKPFAIITQQNIFNANRNPPKPTVAAPKPPRPPQVEAFALLGTMTSEQGAVAFFDGTSTTYRKAVHAGDTLGTCTVTAIAHDRVTLQAGDHQLCLPLKMQFRREDQGEWLLAELPDNFQPTAPPPGQTYHPRKHETQGPSREQVRDYVSGKYQRKLEQLANDPVKSEKLRKAMSGEIEGRIKKLEKMERRQP